MSFHIRWDTAETGSFLSWTKELLHDSLNSGKRPHILSSEINIENLCFGDNPPELEILEIGDLADDKFRGIFKLKYDGDAQIRLSTSIQANLLNILEQNTDELGGEFALPKFPLASQPFSIPLFVNLSQIRLSGIIVVVFSKSKGLTLVFKNDPLENIKVSSSFDNVKVIEKFLQAKIENQIRDLFRDVLPSVLHKVSQKWTTSNLLNQLHSQLKSNDSKIEKVSIFEINPSEPEISPANMLKLSTLTTSRLSFRISIPPFPEVIQRPSLFKYENNSKHVMGNNSKNLPIEIITNNIGLQLDNTLNQIIKIQSKLYHNEKNNTKLKRRTIKMGSKKKVDEKDNQSVSSDSSSQLTLNESELITTTTKTKTLTKDDIEIDPTTSTSLNSSTPFSSPLLSSPVLTRKASTIPIKSKSSKNPSQHISHISSHPLPTSLPSSRSNSLPFKSNYSVELNSPNPLILEKLHQHPLLAAPLTPLKSSDFIQPFRSSSPRKSQSNLMNLGIGNYFHSMRSETSPPPPYV